MDASAGIVTVALLGALALAVNKTVSTVKRVTVGDWRGALTQLLVWVFGAFAILLLVHASFTQAWAIPGLNVQFSSLNWASILLLGWIAGGTGSFTFDFLKAHDNTQTAVEPKLGAPNPPGT